MKYETITIRLTPEQISAIAPLINTAYDADLAGEMGLLIGQIHKNRIICAFVPYDTAREVAKLVNPDGNWSVTID